jgi:hypothetical protein
LNKVSGGKKRLKRDNTTQKKTAIALANFLSKGEAGALVDEPQMHVVSSEIATSVLKKIGDEVRSDVVLATCNVGCVS